MDCKEITRLKFFQLIEEDNKHSQRSISQLLDISLGNVNSMVKSLVKSGCVEIHQKMNSRIQYHITDKGAAEKVRLSYNYLRFSLTFCNEIKRKFENLFNKLTLQQDRHVVFFGSGELAELAFVYLQRTSLELVAVIDRGKSGNRFHEFTILHPCEANKLSFDKIIITSLDEETNIKKVANDLNAPINKLITIN